MNGNSDQATMSSSGSGGSGYQHSRLFAELKHIKEKIGTNLSSFQYLSTLDKVLQRALYPIIANTTFVEHFLAKVLAWQTLNPKRKASNVDHNALATCVTLFMLVDTPEKKMQVLRKAKFDRGVLSELVKRWIEAAEPYEDLVNNLDLLEVDLADREKHLELVANLKPDHCLYGALVQARFWFKHYQEFKNMTLEKYTRKCLMKAKEDYDMFNHRVDLGDIIQVYLFNASKAIDKCDAEKGVLTTHVDNWLKNARNTIQTSYLSGTAYALPKNSKNVNDRLAESNSVSLDDIEEYQPADEIDYERMSDIEQVRYLAKVFDPLGYGRIALGIQETLSKDDSLTLRAHAIKDMVK